MSTIDVKDASGATVPIEKPLVPGQATMATSRPVVIASDQTAVPVSGTVGVTGVATAANQSSELTLVGAVNETAPASDTANSGLNGRLQRIAQRLTSFIALFPASIGQKAKAAALAVTLASDEDSLALLGAVTETAPATDTASSGLNGRLQRVAQRITSLIALVPASLGQKAKTASFAVVLASDDDLLTKVGEVQASPTANTVLDRLKALLTGIILAAGENFIGKTSSPMVTVDLVMTRMTDTNTYAINDAWANSDSAPTAGGYTATGAARLSGGSGVITDILFTSSGDPAVLLQGELWLFDSAPTAINDNAAFALSDSDVLKAVAVIPFTLGDSGAATANNSFAHVQGLGIGFTCSGSANLRALVKVKNAYVPISGEVLNARLKIVQS